jgi:glycosyltransferase involved in cell wall biosynthesis
LRDPLVTVVIPTRNRCHLLPRALRSVLRQTVRELELVVVDDASSDGTRELVEGLSDDRVRLARHRLRRGASAARNTGIRLARGEYVAFLDDDDQWLPGKLAQQLELIEGAPPELGVVYGGYHVASQRSRRVVATSLPPERPLGHSDFLDSTGFMTSIPLIRRRCLEEVGLFDEELPGCQDVDLWIRLAERFAFQAVPGVLAIHNIHGRQISTNLKAKIRAKEMVLLKHASALMQHPRLLVKRFERLGLLHCAAGSPITGRAYLRGSLDLDPSQERLLRQLASSMSDPGAHQRALLARDFARFDGIPLFY